MKKIFLFLCASALLSSCTEETSGDVSRVTNYPNFELIGDDVIYVHKGDAFTDPGVIVTEGENEIDYTSAVVGTYRGGTTLDTSIEDIYTVTYTATNQDGFSGSATRTIIVADTGDLVNNIAGLYRTTVFRNGLQPAANPQDYTDREWILIWTNADGTYGISDAFGGWYLFGRAIPGSETPGGVIVANDIPTNNFSFPGTLTNSYFGGTANITSMTVHPESDTIDYTTVWNTAAPVTVYNFAVHLEQFQF
jgi:hypothetical protein